jgi:hypothetical protein
MIIGGASVEQPQYHLTLILFSCYCILCLVRAILIHSSTPEATKWTPNIQLETRDSSPELTSLSFHLSTTELL